jgi:hypothetical protein
MGMPVELPMDEPWAPLFTEPVGMPVELPMEDEPVVLPFTEPLGKPVEPPMEVPFAPLVVADGGTAAPVTGLFAPAAIAGAKNVRVNRPDARIRDFSMFSSPALNRERRSIVPEIE